MLNSNYKEIFKLKHLLDINDIPYEIEIGYFNGAVIAYPDNVNTICSAIEHDGSYGHSADTIEIMGLLTEKEKIHGEVVGYLTAEDVFSRIKTHYERGFRNEW